MITICNWFGSVESFEEAVPWDAEFFAFFSGHTVDGQNPAPPRMMIIPLFIGF